MKFMAHVYYGDPLVSSGKLVKALKGIDILELGIPFSDPIADGRVFQLACQRALDKGVTPDDVFSFLASLKIDIPVVITTYYNIIYQKGISVFVDLSSGYDVMGIIQP